MKQVNVIISDDVFLKLTKMATEIGVSRSRYLAFLIKVRLGSPGVYDGIKPVDVCRPYERYAMVLPVESVGLMDEGCAFLNCTRSQLINGIFNS